MALSLQVFAQGRDRSGGSDGGGGNGVVCYTSASHEEIVTVELLDFFEGKILDGYNIPEYPGNFEKIYSEVIKKAASAHILKELKKGMALSKGFRFLPVGVRLRPVNDSGEIFLPKNCRVEQLANYQGPSRIFIVKDFWDRMSETSKAGLLMHEFIWMKDREAEVKKSSRARRNVARFFADNFDFGRIEASDLKPGGYRCNRVASSSINILSYDFSVSAPDQSDICHITLSKLSGTTYYTGHTAMINNCYFYK